MKSKVLLMFFSMFCFLEAKSQINFDYFITNIEHQIVLSESFTSSFDPNEYTIGGFIIRDNQYKCVGTNFFNNSSGAISLIIHGEENGKPGYKEGEEIIILMKIRPHNCIQYLDFEVKQGDPIVFTTSATTTVTGAEYKTFDYPIYSKNSICKDTEESITPVDSSHIVRFYRSSDIGLNLDSLSGTVDVSQSQPGNYTISAYSDFCLNNDTFALSIDVFPPNVLAQDYEICQNEIPDIPLSELNNTLQRTPLQPITSLFEDDTLLYETTFKSCITTDSIFVDVFNINKESMKVNVTDQYCENLGLIDLKLQSINDVPVAYHVNDSRFTQFPFEVSSGSYQLIFEDENNCLDTLTELITVKNFNQDCEDDIYYLTPNTNGPSSIYFEEKGMIRIFDKNGMLRAQLNGPVRWQGVDMKGKYLPTDSYIIVFEDGETKTLRIVY